MKTSELSKFRIFVNNYFKTTLNIHKTLTMTAFSEDKKLSHIKSVNEMTGKDV